MPNPLQDSDYQVLFQESPIALALCDMEGVLVAVNEAYAELIGRSVKETLKLSYWQITPRKYEKAEAVQVEALKAHGKYGPYEKEYLHKDGRLIPVRLTGKLITMNGQQYIWSGVTRLRSLFNNILFDMAPLGMALCDMEGKLVAVNQGFADIIGRTIDETLKLTYWEVTPKEYKKKEQEQLKIMKKFGRYGPYLKEYFHKDSHLVPVILNGKILKVNGVEFIWSIVECGLGVTSMLFEGEIRGLQPPSRKKEPENELHRPIRTPAPEVEE